MPEPSFTAIYTPRRRQVKNRTPNADGGERFGSVPLAIRICGLFTLGTLSKKLLGMCGWPASADMRLTGAGVCFGQGYGEDDYLVFDCPGQIELYSHISVFRSFVDFLKRDGWSVAAVYCTDCQFVGDPTKFIAGSLQAMAAMVQLELPHVNLLTKVDLLGGENKVP